MNDSDKLKILRKTLKIKQGVFAQRISTAQGHISDIENGRKNLSERTIKIIASEFNVNEQWLKTGKGNMFKSSPYEKEFINIFETLEPVTQKYLIEIAKNLLEMQKELVLQNDKKE